MKSKTVRTEVERQALIAELRRLRSAGVNVDRQDAIIARLRSEFECGWPAASSKGSRSAGAHQNGVSR